MNRLPGCLILVLLWLPGQVRATAAAPLKVVTMINIQPNHPVVVLMDQAYQRLGLTMQLELMPAERGRIELARGLSLDATLAAAENFSQALPTIVRVPVVIYQLDLHAFTADPMLQVQDWTDLQQLQVSYLQGMESVRLRLQQHQINRLETVMSLEQVLRRLQLGRDKVAVLPRFEAESMIELLQLQGIRRLDPCLAEIPLYHYLHTKHQALVAPLSQVLVELTGNALESADQPLADH